ncbi:glucosamine-6-phosphate deaminase [Alkalihalobacillus sp. AL-G]|uniref:glucosamine-6-phosphate deaminase n=1 Tax=Alkalihalobacillus sp. AL-G TaxID=2926399 RepID=UPI00351BBF7C
MIITKDYTQLSERAAELIIDHMKNNPSLVLGAATGDTPKGTYTQLIKKLNKEDLDLSEIKTVNLDEYVGLVSEHSQSYWTYMKEYLYNPLNLSYNQAIIPNGKAEDLHKECERYEQEINRLGGIDLQILGIGRNGHIGFNEPYTPFDSRTHVVQLTENTRKANARFFTGEEEVPERAITVGISTIMKSKSIVLLASGQEKASAVQAVLNGQVDGAWPATILNNHPDVTFIVDEAAKNG